MRAAPLLLLLGLVGCTDRALELPAGPSAPVDLAGDANPIDLAGRDLAGVVLDLAGVDLAALDLALPGGCGDNDVLVGAACVKRSCEVGDNRLNCLLPSGAVGHCANHTCTTIDFLSDPNNCGVIGMVCPAGTPCTNNFCYGACGAMSCPAGLECSEYGCSLTACDGAHDYQACSYVYTQPDFAAQCCGTKCAHLFSDNKNCGYCGHVCPGNASCNFGVCDVDCTAAIDNTPCGSGTGFCCHGQCKFLGSGCRCGASCFTDCFSTPCPAGQACVIYGGTPMCAKSSCGGQPLGTACAVTDADGVAHNGECCTSGCADVQSDADHCGGCGRRCPSGEICQRGRCVPDAPCDKAAEGSLCRLANGVDGLCCAGACVDVHTDEQNCNGCGLGCPVGATCHGWVGYADHQARCEDGSGAPVTCDAGTPCPAGWSCGYGGVCMPSDCSGRVDEDACIGGRCCGGICTGPGLQNCGSCGRSCPTGAAYCAGGDCLDSGFRALPCGAAAPCAADSECITIPCYFSGCTSHKCFPVGCVGRADGAACAFGPTEAGACCGGACVSVDHDANNCGGCGRVCGQGRCARGLCDRGAMTKCVPDCPSGTLCYEVGPFDGGTPVGVCIGPVCGLITYNNPQLNSGRCLAQDGTLGFCCADGSCADAPCP